MRREYSLLLLDLFDAYLLVANKDTLKNEY